MTWFFCYMFIINFVQALKTKAFNNFTAIYHLLLERWQKCTRLFSMQAEHRMAEDHRRPSTVAEQAVVRFAFGGHPPALSDTRTGPFSRTTDGVDLNAPHRATQQQRIYTSGPQPSAVEAGSGYVSGLRPSLAQMSIDEGVELEASENSYEMLNQPTVPPAAASTTKTNLVSFSSSGGSSDAASFDSTIDADVLASAVQGTPWAFTSGESLSSAGGLECVSAGVGGQDATAENPAESLPGMPVTTGNFPQPTGRCYLVVPGQSNMLQVPGGGAEGGSQDGFFHSGRRASDGLATHGDILKLQQLMKTRGVPEMQKELELLTVPADPRQPSELRSRRVELRHGRPMHQHSFEDGSCGKSGRLSPLSARRSRQPTTGSCMRPRLAYLGRSRQPAATKSPLEELTTLCRMVPTTERNRSPHSSEQQLLQQQFQQLGIEGSSNTQTVAAIPLPVGIIQLPIGTGPAAVASCLSEQRLAAASPPTTLSDVSSCRSQDSIHSYSMMESIAPAHLPVGQPAAGADDGSSGSVRRHMVRRTLYRLVHQQTLISSFGEEDIPEVSPVSEQAAGTGDPRPESPPPSSMDVT